MDYWKKIGANETVLKILDEGYTIPFLTNPKCINLMNNRSALENHEFVTEEIKVLLRTGRIIETEKSPFCRKSFISIFSKREEKVNFRLQAHKPAYFQGTRKIRRLEGYVAVC